MNHAFIGNFFFFFQVYTSERKAVKVPAIKREICAI